MEGSSNLCLVCIKVFGEMRTVAEEWISPYDELVARAVPDWNGKHSYLHHQRFSSLKDSADEKCYICVRLWDFFSDAAGDRDEHAALDCRCVITAPRLPRMDGTCGVPVPIVMKIWFLDQGPRTPLLLDAWLSTGELPACSNIWNVLLSLQ
jgi:hypothetical protein